MKLPYRIRVMLWMFEDGWEFSRMAFISWLRLMQIHPQAEYQIQFRKHILFGQMNGKFM